MEFSDFVFAFVAGCAGYLMVHVVVKATDGSRIKARFRNQNERVLGLVHQLVDLNNDKALLEAELAHILEKEPVDRALWIARMRELADTVPPVVLAQLRRFGLAEPPPEQASVEIPRLETGTVPSSPEQPARENVVAIDAWTGRSR